MKIRKSKWAQQEKSNYQGYTIIEVMIVLAVSGLMFILAALFINGKQDTVAYNQAMSATGSLVTDTINSVANGEFPSMPDHWSCDVNGSGEPQLSRGTGKSQGTNDNCIFLGKVMQFEAGEEGNYKIYTVMARQFKDDTLTPVQNFSDANPRVAEGSSLGSHVDLTTEDVLERALSYTGAYRCDDTNCVAIGGIGFLGSFDSYSSDQANDQSSGAQSVTVVTLPSSDSIPEGVKALSDSDILSGGDYAVLCFERGSTPGEVTVGGLGGQSTSVTVIAHEMEGGPC